MQERKEAQKTTGQRLRSCVACARGHGRCPPIAPAASLTTVVALMVTEFWSRRERRDELVEMDEKAAEPAPQEALPTPGSRQAG